MTKSIVRRQPTELTSRARAVADVRRECVGAFLLSLAEGVSRETMRACLQNIVAAFGSNDPIESFPWEALTANRVEGLMGKLAAPRVPVVDGESVTRPGLGYASVGKHLSAMNGVIRRCRRERIIAADDAIDILTLKRPKGSRLLRGRAVAVEERAALSKARDIETAGGARDVAMVSLLYACGLRRAEVASMTFGAYNAAAGTVSVIGKGNREREIAVTGGAKLAVDHWITFRGRAPGPMFYAVTRSRKISATRRGVSGSAVLKVLSSLVELAGGEKCSPHDMRRSFIGDLLDAGVDIVTVQKMAGHASVQTTAMYDRRPARAQRAASALLDVPFPRGPST